jgi:predicted O-methyltransferase YrrM
MEDMDRLDFFMKQKEENRFWWFKRYGYLPEIYARLTDEQFNILVDWFEESQKEKLVGECNIPAMSLLIGLIDGSGIDAIVQLGHLGGWSTLMFGWALQRMGKERALFSIDINPKATEFTQRWIDLAGLGRIVSVDVVDSRDKKGPSMASSYLRKNIKLVFIDSSHMYKCTLRELDIWHNALVSGGLILLHDSSIQGSLYDSTGDGGVRGALVEWCTSRKKKYLSLNDSWIGNLGPDNYPASYADGCGLGIIQKEYGE